MTTCVLGLGLIGGSVLRALDGTGAFGYNRGGSTVDAAIAAGYDASIDLESTLIRAAATDALIVVAVPAPVLDEVFAAIARFAPDNAVTDVTSVKRAVRAAADSAGIGARFVGGHPMAGTAAAGWSAANRDLFEDAVWVVETDDGVDPAGWMRVARLARACGAVVVAAGSAEHDAAAARISHAVHVTACATAAVGAADPLAIALAAGSFRDGIRVAGTSVGQIRAIVEANPDATVAALDETIALLTAARAELAERGEIGTIAAAGNAGYRVWDRRERRPEPLDGINFGPGWEARLRAASASGVVFV